MEPTPIRWTFTDTPTHCVGDGTTPCPQPPVPRVTLCSGHLLDAYVELTGWLQGFEDFRAFCQRPVDPPP